MIGQLSSVLSPTFHTLIVDVGLGNTQLRSEGSYASWLCVRFCPWEANLEELKKARAEGNSFLFAFLLPSFCGGDSISQTQHLPNRKPDVGTSPTVPPLGN